MIRTLRRSAALVVAVSGFVLAASAAVATASEGSVPAEVREYVESGDLVARLADVYGPDGAGNGIDFDDTTATGEILRVHAWTAARIAGEDTDTPIELLNQWVVPISVANEPVGLATIWINPDRDVPELARFDGDPDLAVALTGVPETAALVHDEASSAWLALSDDDVVTPLVAGSSGLTGPIPLAEIALLPRQTPEPAPASTSGLGLAIGVIVVLVLVIVAALLFPGWRARRAESDATES